MKQSDTQIAVVDDWAIATDGIQWIVQHHFGNRWRPLKYVRSTKNVLARCLHEAGAGREQADALLKGLPDRFQEAEETVRERG